jgi:Ferritin-like domain
VPTRRQFVAGTLAAAGGLAATPGSSFAAAGVPSDSEVMGKVLQVERLMVLAYRQVLASGTLAAGEEAALRQFLAQELEHVAAVATRLEALGASADTSPLDLTSGETLLAKHHVPGSLSDVHSRTDCLKLLVNLESVAEGAYFTTLKTLGSAELVTLSAQAMACEAQHWTVISGLRNPGIYVKSVPWPFVTGSS